MSAPGTCSTCRHWDSTNIWAGSADEPGEAYGRCEQAASDNGLPRHGKIPLHPAYARDGEQYTAALRTLPTFGCNVWTAR